MESFNFSSYLDKQGRFLSLLDGRRLGWGFQHGIPELLESSIRGRGPVSKECGMVWLTRVEGDEREKVLLHHFQLL